jgi:hypothetical protein
MKEYTPCAPLHYQDEVGLPHQTFGTKKKIFENTKDLKNQDQFMPSINDQLF